MADSWDVVVIGGGISGLSFAEFAARRGHRVLLREASDRLGGCLRTERFRDEFWLELGAHTAYNSYGGFIDILETGGASDRIIARRKAPFRLWRDGALGSIGGALAKVPVAVGLLSLPFRSRKGRTVAEYFGGIVGRKNYERVVSRLLSAVPSQKADSIPAEMLFKKRPRRKDLPRSFTLRGGLQSIADVVTARENVTVETNHGAKTVYSIADGRWRVEGPGGDVVETDRVALAVPPNVAAGLLRKSVPDVASALERIAVTEIISLGVVVDAEEIAHVDPFAGVVPGDDDIFWSVVSRDVVPDERYRAFTMHFRSDTDAAERSKRIQEVLGIPEEAIAIRFQARSFLPSPVLGHDTIVASIDRAIAETTLAVTGNYFAGLAIEDCVSRSRSEVERIS